MTSWGLDVLLVPWCFWHVGLDAWPTSMGRCWVALATPAWGGSLGERCWVRCSWDGAAVLGLCWLDVDGATSPRVVGCVDIEGAMYVSDCWVVLDCVVIEGAMYVSDC